MPAYVVIRFDHTDGRSCINGSQGSGEPCGTRTNHHNIRFEVPARWYVSYTRSQCTRTDDVGRIITSTCSHNALSPSCKPAVCTVCAFCQL
jgi:hypothetical protein